MFYDVTLRDGNHALRHKLSPGFVEQYCSQAEKTDSWAVEVGHGNGLGASSYLVGKSIHTDHALIIAARRALITKKLAVHSIPGFSTIKRDLIPAIDLGVDIFRIATHVTESDIAQSQIEFLKKKEKEVHGVLMMSHMTSIQDLVNQAYNLQNYGAEAIIIMDSAGYFVPTDVQARICALKDKINVPLGFHAHNNLGVAVSNAVTALDFGATIIDGASMGLGAGAGNAQLESIIAVQKRANASLALDESLALSDLVAREYSMNLPKTSSSSIYSGFNGVFSGYAPQVREISDEFGIEQSVLWGEIAKRKLVAGQETMIREIAQDLMNL